MPSPLLSGDGRWEVNPANLDLNKVIQHFFFFAPLTQSGHTVGGTATRGSPVGIARRVREMRERASVVTKHHQFVSPVRQIKLPPPWARSLIGEDLGGGLRLRLPVMRLTLPAVTLLAHVVERGDELAQLPFRLVDTLGEFLVDPLKLHLVNAWVIQRIHACNFGHVNRPLAIRVLGPGHLSVANGPHDRGPADPGGVSGLL